MPGAGFLLLPPCPELQGTRGLRRTPSAGRATECPPPPGGGRGEGEAWPMQGCLPLAAWPTPGTSSTQAKGAVGGTGSSEFMGENGRWKNWGGNTRRHSLLLAPGPGPTLEDFNTDHKGTVKAPHVRDPRCSSEVLCSGRHAFPVVLCSNHKQARHQAPAEHRQALTAPARPEDGPEAAYAGQWH